MIRSAVILSPILPFLKKIPTHRSVAKIQSSIQFMEAPRQKGNRLSFSAELRLLVEEPFLVPKVPATMMGGEFKYIDFYINICHNKKHMMK